MHACILKCSKNICKKERTHWQTIRHTETIHFLSTLLKNVIDNVSISYQKYGVSFSSCEWEIKIWRANSWYISEWMVHFHCQKICEIKKKKNEMHTILKQVYVLESTLYLVGIDFRLASINIINLKMERFQQNLKFFVFL